MKNIKYTISLLMTMAFMSIALNAQNWQPFPAHQVTYWQLAPDSIDLYYCDSTFTNNGQLYQVNGADYYRDGFPESCVDSMYITLSVSNPYGHILPLPPKPDTFWMVHDTAYFMMEGQAFPFYTQAIQGQTWGSTIASSMVDSLYFRCDTIAEETFLGFTDSVRTFSVQAFWNNQPLSNLNGITYKLSKQAGFISYIPFDKIGTAIDTTAWSIYGFYTSTLGRHGYVNSLSDYEPPCISIGDIVKRREAIYWITVDSIVGILTQGDTTWITYMGYGYDRLNGIYTPPSSQYTVMKIKSQQDKPIMDWVKPNNSMAIVMSYSPVLQTYYFDDNHALCNLSTSISLTASFDEFSTTCMNPFGSLGTSITHLRKAGVSVDYTEAYSNESGLGNYLSFFYGSRHCGVVIGDVSTNFPIGVSSLNNIDNPINIYPNPTNSVLNVIGDFESVEVHNLTGQLLLQSNDKELNLDELPAGLYLLLVKKDNQLIYTDKVMKL